MPDPLSHTPDPSSEPIDTSTGSKEALRSTYAERVRHFTEAIRRESGWINAIAFGRLGALVATVWILVLAIRHQGFALYALTLLLAAGFLYLVTLHNRHNQQRELYRQLKALNEREQECLEHRFGSNPDGRKFADPSHAWSHDLDIFGRGSLFQYLNRTSLLRGEQLLAEWLTTEPDGHEMILQRQGIVTDLKERLEFRQQYTGRARMIKEEEEDLDNLSRWLEDRSYIQTQGWLFYLAWVMSALSLGMVTGLILGMVSIWGLLLLLMVNFTILSPFLMRTNRYQSSISKKHLLLEGYAGLLKLVAEEPFEHDQLKENGERSREGMREVARLSRLLNLFDQRLNMLLGVILNGLFLFDFIMLRLLETWKEKNSRHILDWIELIGWTEAMVSLGGFAHNHPDFTWPEIQPGVKEMELEGLGHPLIPDQKRVDNDLRIESEKVVVITGANMAGKSTFLRSLGINLVLAYTGCPVCAHRFRTAYMGLCSSMRTADSLKDEESYFLAEIKKL
ncbi:MAG: MutS-related protein [Bacteroidales bacterium]